MFKNDLNSIVEWFSNSILPKFKKLFNDFAVWLQKKSSRKFPDTNIPISTGNALALAKRAAGMSYLRTIFTYEMMNYAETGNYISKIDDLDIHNKSKDYSITIITDGRNYLTIRGEANLDNDSFKDVIIVDKNGQFFIIADDIKNERIDFSTKPSASVPLDHQRFAAYQHRSHLSLELVKS